MLEAFGGSACHASTDLGLRASGSWGSVPRRVYRLGVCSYGFGLGVLRCVGLLCRAWGMRYMLTPKASGFTASGFRVRGLGLRPGAYRNSLRA